MIINILYMKNTLYVSFQSNIFQATIQGVIRFQLHVSYIKIRLIVNDLTSETMLSYIGKLHKNYAQ
jgi:hypothetical protein